MSDSPKSLPPQARRPYGADLGASFGAETSRFLLSRAVPNAEIAVTEVRRDQPFGRISDPFPDGEGFLICYPLLGQTGMGYWEEGRHRASFDLKVGEATIHDLRREPLAYIGGPIHTMLWFLPQAALDTLADEGNVPRISGVNCEPGAGLFDETIDGITLAVLAALQAPGQASPLFVDHLTMAFAAHLARTYGGMLSSPRLIPGGLAPWQERRALDMIRGDLAQPLTLAEIAEACGLSASYFSRAFRRSTGATPHAFLLQARVERAKVLLKRKDLLLAEVASACGFADQSHFTRVFARKIGLTPGAWRQEALGWGAASAKI
jgi:AraC family transcriptional regulator